MKLLFILNYNLWLKALQDLENSASSDAVVREKIARLPPEVSETSHLEKIGSTDEGLKLLTQVIRCSSFNSWYIGIIVRKA